jgi:hypothetical protein
VQLAPRPVSNAYSEYDPPAAVPTSSPLPPMFLPKERTSEVKKQDVFIKKEYLPAKAKLIKPEKGREDVTRVLNFNNFNDKNATSTNKNSNILIKIESPKNSNLDEKLIKKERDVEEKEPPTTNTKVEVKKESDRSTPSSSKHKSSSSSSSHRSSRDCSRCYKRSKIKRANVGVQCRRDRHADATPKEISPRIGIANRDFNCTRKGLEHLKYGRFMRIEYHPNGGASIVHMYQDEISVLNEKEMDELVEEFFTVCMAEDEHGFSHHVMGIVHDAAAYLPDLLEHMAENYSDLTVKAGVIGRNSDIETLSMEQYRDQVGELVKTLRFQ